MTRPLPPPALAPLCDPAVEVGVSPGHRSGAVIMVRTGSPYRRFKDLTGKRIAICQALREALLGELGL